MENKPNQLCFQLPSSSRSVSGGTGGPSQALEKLLPRPSFLLFEFGSFMSMKDLEHSWLLKTVSRIQVGFPRRGWSYNPVRRGMCMLKKAMVRTLKSWGTINLKCWSKLICKQANSKSKLHGDESRAVLTWLCYWKLTNISRHCCAPSPSSACIPLLTELLFHPPEAGFCRDTV